jgi:hypothetical protein
MRLILAGAVAAVIGLVLAVALRQIALQHIGAFIGYGGLGIMLVGIILAKMASWWVYIGWALAAAIAVAAVVLLRNHGLDAWILSHISIRRAPASPAPATPAAPSIAVVPGSEKTISIPLSAVRIPSAAKATEGEQ